MSLEPSFSSVTGELILQGKLGPPLAPGPETVPTEISFYLSTGFYYDSIHSGLRGNLLV